MPRPPIPRCVRFKPRVFYFKPQGIPLKILEEISLSMAEIEAIRLCDLNDLDQKMAAQQMKISQSTLQRILTQGRKKIAEAIIKGKALRIEL